METLSNLAAALITEPWTLLLPEEDARLRYDHDLLICFTGTLHKNVGKVIADSWDEALQIPPDTEQVLPPKQVALRRSGPCGEAVFRGFFNSHRVPGEDEHAPS